MQIYRITLKCHGIGAGEGAQTAKDIEEAFCDRTWHVDVHCWWDGTSLFVTAWNDFDDSGLALRDEVSDLLSASIRMPFDGEIETVEVLAMR